MLAALLLFPLLSLLPFKEAGQRLLVAVTLSLISLAHATLLVVLYDPCDAQYQFVSDGGLLGIDGLSLALIWLVTLLMPITLLSLGRTKLLVAIHFWSLALFMVMDLLLF